ncbi:MAG TPA: nucleotidyltransferase domain-containing protein [Candidatus Paceibacterota bacterium]
MTIEKQDELLEILKKYPTVKLGYLFGSRARNDVGPLSDYDFAFYLDESDVQARFETKLKLQNDLSTLYQTDLVDVVILNSTQSPELKYQIIRDGILFFEREPFVALIEPKILNEYFDFYSLLRRYGLTKA